MNFVMLIRQTGCWGFLLTNEIWFPLSGSPICLLWLSIYCCPPHVSNALIFTAGFESEVCLENKANKSFEICYNMKWRMLGVPCHAWCPRACTRHTDRLELKSGSFVTSCAQREYEIVDRATVAPPVGLWTAVLKTLIWHYDQRIF